MKTYLYGSNLTTVLELSMGKILMAIYFRLVPTALSFTFATLSSLASSLATTSLQPIPSPMRL